MSDLRGRLEEELRKAPRSVEDAERSARVAEALAAYIRLEQQVRRLLDPTADEEAEELARSRPGRSLSDLTLHDAAERILERAGRPLHVRELGKRIKAGGWTHPRSENPRRDLIQYQLAARLPRHADRFRRVAPNTFALVKWGRGPTRAAARPKVGLFAGPGDVASQIGDHPEEVVEAHAWR